MKITTEDCRSAIAPFVREHPECVASQFDPPEDETAAGVPKNWVRIEKRKADQFDRRRVGDGVVTVREFDCRPYDDQLRAAVYDDGQKIVFVSVRGE